MARKRKPSRLTVAADRTQGFVTSAAKLVAPWTMLLIFAFIVGSGFRGCVATGILSKVLPNISIPPLRKILPRPFQPKDAIVKINMSNSMCSATIIGPVNDDDEHIDLLTAAHCVQIGQTGTVTMNDGRQLPFRCVSRAQGPDVAWIRCARPDGIVPFLLLADVAPPPGARVWHQGFGIDRPRNLEEGTVVGVGKDNSQVSYRLSVSPGDSGGGIILSDDEKVISPVCCTTKLGGTGTVWGGTPYWTHKIRPTKSAYADEGTPVHPIMRCGPDGCTIGCPTCPRW